MRAHSNAKVNMSSCGTLHCWVRGAAVLQASHTSGETSGKAAVSSLLIIELKPNQLPLGHKHTSQGNPKLVGPDRLDPKGTSELRRQDPCAVSSETLLTGRPVSPVRFIPTLSPLVVVVAGALPSGPSGFLFLLSLLKETREPEMYTPEKGWHRAHLDYESSQDYQEAG